MATMASTFSYAQAAKGFSSPAPTKAADQSTKSTQPSDQNKSETQPIANGTNSSKQQSTAPVDASSSTEVSTDLDKSQSLEGKVLTKESLTVSTDAGAPKNPVSGATSPSDGTASSATLPKEDDISFTPNGTSDSTWDKQSQISGPVEKVDEASTEKSSENEGAKSASASKELKAAPIPAVNVWQQRMETQNAKVKSNAGPKPNGTHMSKTAAKNLNASQPTVSESQLDNSKGANKKKFGGAQDATSETKDRRRQVDAGKFKDEDSALPPVDSASWPTPQLAQGEEKRKAQEKNDKGEKVDKERSPAARTHGKDKWMPVPYVPTAVFNTPLPQRGGGRGGGRPARGGGRDGAARGRGHGSTPSVGGDKAVATGSTNQTSVPKQGTPSERGRQESSATQTDFLPPQARRHTSADPATTPEQRKISQSHQSERFGNDMKFSKSPADNQNGVPTRPDFSHMSGSETLPKHRQDVRGFSKTQEPPFPQKGVDQSHRHVSLQGDYHGPSRFGTSRERRFDSGPRSAEFFRDPSGSFNSRDRDTRERGDSRPERGRGGYRGRGGHSPYAGSQNSQYHMYQQGNHTYQPPKPYINERHRSHQQGPQNGTQPQNPNARLNIRSPSLPNSAMYNSYPVPPDYNAMYGYPPMQPGPMSAVPYQPYLEPFSLMSMISMQLEYYFSVDNLCKDMFLRKHMDSQGFVPFSVIASFKRIKSLTEDLDLLRHVCRQIKGVEYRLGEDGVDRLRKREMWEQWVLSMELRDPSARHEGPPPNVSFSPIHVDGVNENHFPVNHVDEFSAPLANGSAHHASPSRPGVVNGVNGTHVSKTPLSSTAPEFSPSVPMTQGGNLNGGNASDQNTFPDEQVENLVIVVRKPGFSSPPHPSPNPTSGSFSNGLIDGCRTMAGVVTTQEPPFNPIQAGTTSAERSEPSQLQEINDNILSTPVSIKDSTGTDSSMSTFWVKDKDAPIEVLPTDLLHESYNVFRKQAIKERQSNTDDDGHRNMDVLYQFWSHFLIRNFNAGMYDEFKSLAFDDVSSKKSTRGLDHLIHFYDATLSSNRAISQDVAKDLITVVKTETGGDGRNIFQRLRSAWKNDAFNPNTRRKIDSFLDEDLRAELER